MKAKRKPIIKYIILIVIAVIYMIPIWMVIMGSFKSKGEAMKFNLSLPDCLDFSNYSYVIENSNVVLSYYNSIYLTVFATALVLLFGSLTGIYIGRSKNKISNIIYNYFILGLTITLQMATIFGLLKVLNIYGTRWSVIFILISLNLPFTVMTFSSFIKGIPRDIDEAGIIDGCGSLRLIFSILLPIMKPIFITNLIVVAISTWNNFMIPLFYLDSSQKWPIPLLVYNFFGRFNRNWNYVFALLILTILPVTILYLCLQKYIVEGMTTGAVKG